MEEIEKATGKQIIRIETNDLDVMEEVSGVMVVFFPALSHGSLAVLFDLSANEESLEVMATPFFPPSCLYTCTPTSLPVPFVCIHNTD